ncbi:unnamed protein product, partial [Polarella glacialis]
VSEPPWQLLRDEQRQRRLLQGSDEFLDDQELDGEEDGVEDDFVSTENFVLALPRGAAGKLGKGGGAHAELLAQIREDTGAATRVSGSTDSDSASGSSLEIAGCYGAKLRALLEVSALLLQMAPLPLTGAPPEGSDPEPPAASDQEALEIWLRSSGPFSFTAEEASKLVSIASASASAEFVPSGAPGRSALRLAGPRASVCAAALAIGRQIERKAVAHERSHGPPVLLVEYLTRWFGLDASRLLKRQRLRRGQKRRSDDRPEQVNWPAEDEWPGVEEGPSLPEAEYRDVEIATAAGEEREADMEEEEDEEYDNDVEAQDADAERATKRLRTGPSLPNPFQGAVGADIKEDDGAQDGKAETLVAGEAMASLLGEYSDDE